MLRDKEHTNDIPTRPEEVREKELDRQRQQLIDDLAVLVVREHRRRLRARSDTTQTAEEPLCRPTHN